MATGERLTVTYSHPPSGPLKLDIYCFVPPLNPIDPSPNLDRLPFLLYLHSGHFATGSRRDVPPWIVSLAKSLGTPLLCADYRLLPAGPEHAVQDLKVLWAYLKSELPWVIACSGNGSEVESGTEPLGEDFIDLQHRGGLDINQGIIIGLGSGGYLAAMGGAYLSPPPIALVLGYPTLDFVSLTGTKDENTKAAVASASIPEHLKDVLSEVQSGDISKAKSEVPDLPLLLNKAPYAVNVLECTGMNTKERWVGKEESKRRQGLVEYLLRTNQWTSTMKKASPNLESVETMLKSKNRINRPYPPCLIFHGIEDDRVPYKSSQRYVENIRREEPAAALVDALSHSTNSSSGSTSRPTMQSSKNGSISFKNVEEINVTSRYLYLGIEKASHGFDALLPRLLLSSSGNHSTGSPKVMADRFKAGMIHVEYFVKHWFGEGSTLDVQKNGQDVIPDSMIENKNNSIQPEQSRGARVKMPRGGPRL